jgi:hypothetical protein
VRERWGRKSIRSMWSWVKRNWSNLFFAFICRTNLLEFFMMKYDEFLNSILKFDQYEPNLRSCK